jgi:hypothetical protein
MQGPVRLAQKLAREHDGISLARPDDVVRLRRLSNHPHGYGRDSRLTPDAFRKWHLIARTKRNSYSRRHASGRAIHQTHSQPLEHSGQRDRILNRPATFHPVCTGNPD